MEIKEIIPVQELLDALLDEINPLRAKYLYRLSDIPAKDLEKLRPTWPLISIKRRERLVEDLEELEETNPLLSFEACYHLSIKDEAATVRKLGIRALWQYEDVSLIPILLDILENDPAEEVRAQAATGLGWFIYLAELDKISPDKAMKIETALLKILDGDEPDIIRRGSLESIGYSTHNTVEAYIQDACQRSDERWVASALIAIGRSADDQWAATVIEKLNDVNPVIRREAARAAGELQLERAKPDLLYLMEGELDENRMAAAWALSEIGGEEARDGLETLLAESVDETEIEFLEEALENLSLTEKGQDFNLFDYSEADLEDLIDSPSSEDL